MNAPNSILKLGLIGNAIFSSLSGVILLAAARPLSVILGLSSPRALIAIGCLLLPFAVHLLVAARRKRARLGEIYYFCTMDLLWVLGSAILVLSGALPFTKAGLWIVGIVALAVADFLVIQFIGAIQFRRRAN